MATVNQQIGVDRRLPFLHRIAAGARRVVRGPGTRLIYHSPVARPLRRALSSSAPRDPILVTVCGGELKGSRLWVDLSCEKYYWLGMHEKRVQQFVAKHVKPGLVVYDVGAHIGFFTLLFSKLTSPAGRVYAFEPLAENFDRLAANIEANALCNVEAFPLAISGENGRHTFARDASSLKGYLAEKKPDDAQGLVQVETRTIDTIVSGGARMPDLLKIDVEGAEASVIRGAAGTIQTYRPRMVIEIHSSQAGRELAGALPIPYVFQDIATGRDTALPCAAGHYFARPRETVCSEAVK